MVIDIHTHVLPGLDDGPKNFSDTDALLKQCKVSGIDVVFCTPHYNSPYFEVSQNQIDKVFDDVMEKHPGNVWPKLIKGAEVRLSRRLISDIRENRVPTLGESRYVLVEFPTPEITTEHLDLIHELNVRDYLPIMAHPERNIAVQKQPKLLSTLQQLNIQMQITASYYTKPMNPKQPASVLAWTMLRQGKVAFVASDTHNLGERPPTLTEAHHYLQTVTSVERDLLTIREQTERIFGLQ